MRRRTTDTADLRGQFRAVLVDRLERPWASRAGYEREITRLDAGETLCVRQWELRRLGVPLPDGEPHSYDVHEDGSLSPSVIARSA